MAPADHTPALSDERILHLWDTHVAYETNPSRPKQPPLDDKDKLAFARAVLYAAAGVAVGAPGTTDAERAAWLADKIVALGDYAKEAAAMLRRWPAGVLETHELNATLVVRQEQSNLNGKLGEAYDQIDRYLRNNLDDEDYADYSQALDMIYTYSAK